MFTPVRSRMDQPGPPRRPDLSSKEVEEFARKARWQVHSDDTRAHRARCLDGRYKPGAGVIAMPGADVGVLAIALAAGRWLEERFSKSVGAEELRHAVFGVVGGMGNFSYHTDRASLAVGTERYFGCSYCRLLSVEPALFQPHALDCAQLVRLRQTLEGLERERIRPDILRGGHDEAAVLFVRNVHDLVNAKPLSPEDIRQARKVWVLDNCAVLRGAGRRRAFVYQRDLAETRLSALADALARAIGAGASRADEVRQKVREIGAAHVRRALQHLAGDLPFYEVLIDVESGEIAEPERMP
jgi:hypothetical protein